MQGATTVQDEYRFLVFEKGDLIGYKKDASNSLDKVMAGLPALRIGPNEYLVRGAIVANKLYDVEDEFTHAETFVMRTTILHHRELEIQDILDSFEAVYGRKPREAQYQLS